MKLNKKEEVYEFIESYSLEMKHDEYPKFTTNFLSEKLDMQRTNLSSILNQLVKEGRLLKHNGRPVLYQYIDPTGDGDDAFSELIGHDGSLLKAVSQAKAAILYPEGKPNILLTAERGCGVNYFAHTVFQFAVKSGVVKAGAELLSFDCKAYMENEQYRNNVLFGTKEREGLLEQSRNGMLLIKNVELLPGYERRQILTAEKRGVLLFEVTPDIKEETMDSLKGSMDFMISLPNLKERSLKERFLLIQKFFMEEAKNLKKNLEVESPVLIALLLYDVTENVRGLKNDIHTGCAACYARAHQSRNRFIEVFMSDFPNQVRKGIIYYKVCKAKIDALVSDEFKYAFTHRTMLRKQVVKKEEKAKNIYQSLDVRKKQLRDQSVTEEEMDTFVSVKLQTDFQTYFNDLCGKMKSREQLEAVVSMKLIRLVEAFLKEAKNRLNQEYGEKMLGAICFHINGCLVRVDSRQRISNEEIKQLMLTYPKEYELARSFVRTIEQEFRISMNVDEVIYLVLFLIQNKKIGAQRVVTLLAMHGKNGAGSIKDVVNVMTKETTTYSYDLALDKNMKDAYEELKETMIKIHQGKGILLIYDMGSIRIMAEAIAAETGIEVRYFEVPVSLLAIAVSGKASEDFSLEEICQYLQRDFKHMEYVRENRKSNIQLENLLSQKEITEKTADMTQNQEDNSIYETYDYLREQFENLDMDIMEHLLYDFIQQVEYLMDVSLDEDKRIALIIHIVCLVDRMQSNYTPAVNFIASDIISEHKSLVLEVKKILRPLEEAFEVYVNDGEIATIISIIRK